MEFDYIEEPTREGFVARINALLAEGWALYGTPTAYDDGGFGQAMIRQSQNVPRASTAERFALGYDALDQKLKDLLTINGITLAYNDAHFLVEHDGKTDELSPFRVSALLKEAKHKPVNLDEQWVIQEIERCFK